MKSLCSFLKLLDEIRRAVFWQPEALNHCFMMDGKKENVSMFLVLIYAHWSLESLIIWPKQMDREIPQGFSVLHVLTTMSTNGVHMLEQRLAPEISLFFTSLNKIQAAGNICLSLSNIRFQWYQEVDHNQHCKQQIHLSKYKNKNNHLQKQKRLGFFYSNKDLKRSHHG